MNLFINQPVKSLSFHWGESVSDAGVVVSPIAFAILKDHYSFLLLFGYSGSLPLGFRTMWRGSHDIEFSAMQLGKGYIPVLIMMITCAWETVVFTVMVNGHCHPSKG